MPARCGVCAIGVEPNPRLTANHVKLQAALRQAGVGALWFSETAADVTAGSTTIETRGAKLGPSFVGGQLGTGNHPVATIDLARLVHFVHRTLVPSDDGRPSRLVMKLDTEGSEYRLLPHLLAHNAACLVDRLYLEFHPPDTRNRGVEAEWKREVEEFAMHALGTPPCKTVASVMDDETFLLDGKPLPDGRICPHASNRTVAN